MNKEETQNLVKVLKTIEPGFFEYPLFNQFARLMVVPGIELVPLRMGEEGGVEILLLPRDPDDEVWPGMVHTPGTVIRTTDVDSYPDSVFERILNEELKGTSVSDFTYVREIMHKSRRGVELAKVFYGVVEGEPKAGKFYPADALPANLVESQIEFIADAVKLFKSRPTS